MPWASGAALEAQREAEKVGAKWLGVGDVGNLGDHANAKAEFP